MTNDRPLKCFLSYASDQKAMAVDIAAVLQKLNVDTFTAEDVSPGQAIRIAILSALNAADFVCVLVSHGTPSVNVAFEAGVAVGLSKPVLVLAQDATLPFENAHGIQILRFKTGDLASVVSDLRRFVRHIKPRPEPVPTRAAPDQPSMARATAELAKLRQSNSTQDRARALVNVVAQLFSQPNLEVIREEATQNDERPDLFLWSDAVVAAFGGPLIIECKYYGGSSGSVIANARHALQQLRNNVEKSSASLGLLVFDHDRARDLKLSQFESPQALAFYVDDLFEAVRTGKLIDELWRRRTRAAQLKGFGSDAG